MVKTIVIKFWFLLIYLIPIKFVQVLRLNET